MQVGILSDYKQFPLLFKNFFQQQSSQPISSKTDESVFEEILKTNNWPLKEAIKKMIKGSIIAACLGFYMEQNMNINNKHSINMRYNLNPKSHIRRFKTYFGYGAIAGLAWWFIYDHLFCPHGSITFQRYIMAYATGGALLFATIYHPASILYGAAIGAAFGSLMDSFTSIPQPKNIQLYIKDFDQEKRKIQLRQDQERQLSQRVVIRQKRPFHSI